MSLARYSFLPWARRGMGALVEAPDLARQGKLLVALMQMETMPLAASASCLARSMMRSG